MIEISTDKSRIDIADVFALPSHRRRGIARQLMQAIRAHPDLQGLRRWSLVTSDAHALYRQFGFRELSSPEKHMEDVARNPYGGGGLGDSCGTDTPVCALSRDDWGLQALARQRVRLSSDVTTLGVLKPTPFTGPVRWSPSVEPSRD